MPIVDNELFSLAPVRPESPAVAAGRLYRQQIQENLQKHGDGTWITDVSTGKSMTYSQLVDKMDRVACALKRRGLQSNETVLVIASNYVEVAVFFFGVWAAGGVNACLTLNLLPEDIRTRTREIGATFVLTDALRAGRVLEATVDVASVREVFVVGEYEGATSIDQLFQEPIKDLPDLLDIGLDDMAWLHFSSGTTGVPKAIVHNHRTMNSVLKSWGDSHGVKCFFINPMVNGGGSGAVLGGSSSHVQLFTISEFSDEALLVAIDKVKPMMVSLFPSQVAYICRHPNLDQYDLSSIIFMNTMGSTINPIYERQIYDKVPNLNTLAVTYGLTEMFGLTSTFDGVQLNLTRQQIVERHIVGSSGRLLPGCRLKILDPETGEKLGPGQIGEICGKTPTLMKEYLNKPEETAKTIIDGWIHTGDKGYYDEDERLFVIGRYKELIKYRMAHVVPTNIEKHLLTHPAVEDAGVVGQPHDVDGELPTAFVVVRVGQSTTAEEIIRFIDERVMDEERLRGGVRFTGRIPRNDLGKIVRPELMKFLPKDRSSGN